MDAFCKVNQLRCMKLQFVQKTFATKIIHLNKQGELVLGMDQLAKLFQIYISNNF